MNDTSERDSAKARPVGLVPIFSNRQKLLNIVLVCCVIFLLFIVFNKDSETTVVSAKSNQVNQGNESNFGQQANIEHQKKLLQLKKEELELEAKRIELAKTYTRIVEARNSEGLQKKSALDLSGTDNCEGKPSTSVNADTQSLRVNGKSCVLLRLSGSVTTLQGKWYEIAVPVPNVPNNYYKCGTVDGRNDSESKCAQFATRYSGREMYITVFEGGYVYLE